MTKTTSTGFDRKTIKSQLKKNKKIKCQKQMENRLGFRKTLKTSINKRERKAIKNCKKIKEVFTRVGKLTI